MNEGISEWVKRHVLTQFKKKHVETAEMGHLIRIRRMHHISGEDSATILVPHFGAPLSECSSLDLSKGFGNRNGFFLLFPLRLLLYHATQLGFNPQRVFLNWVSTAEKGVSNIVPNSRWLHTPSPSDVYGPVKIHPEKQNSVFKYCIWVTITMFLAKYSKLLQTIFHNQPSSRYVCPIPSRLMTINSPRRIGFLKCWYPFIAGWFIMEHPEAMNDNWWSPHEETTSGTRRLRPNLEFLGQISRKLANFSLDNAWQIWQNLLGFMPGNSHM